MNINQIEIGHWFFMPLPFYRCPTSICTSPFLFNYLIVDHLKLIYEVRGHNCKKKFDFSLYNFFCSGVMPLLILAGVGAICVKLSHGNPLTLLAHLAKDNVSFCHHLASVVRQLFTSGERCWLRWASIVLLRL